MIITIKLIIYKRGGCVTTATSMVPPKTIGKILQVLLEWIYLLHHATPQFKDKPIIVDRNCGE